MVPCPHVRLVPPAGLGDLSFRGPAPLSLLLLATTEFTFGARTGVSVLWLSDGVEEEVPTLWL